MAAKSGLLDSDSSSLPLVRFPRTSSVLRYLPSLPEGDQVPRAIGCRCLLSKDVEIPVVGANLVEDALWVVPLVEYCFNRILLPFHVEPNRSFVSFSARITFHIYVHRFHCRAVTRPRFD